GGDNDIWNVALPAWAIAATMSALAAPVRAQALFSAAIAGTALGLQACVWSGWLFTAGVVALGFLAAALDHLGQGVSAAWRRTQVGIAGDSIRMIGRHLTMAATVFAATFGVVLIVQGLDAALRLLPLATSTAQPLADTAAIFPDGLRYITETQRPSLASLVRMLGGRGWVYAAVLGLMLLRLPRRGSAPAGVAALAAAAAWLALLLAYPPENDALRGVAVAVPFAMASMWRWLIDEDGSAPASAALVVAVWLAAGIYAASASIRLALLLAPAVGIAAGGGAGYLAQQAMWAWRRPAGVLVATAGMALLVATPLQRGFEQAGRAVPRLNDAWWDILAGIGERAPTNAIVHSWWDYGYWIQYAAERPVLMDGASVMTRAPHWFARALLANSEQEAIGLLRMLSCGPDVVPAPEGERGAYRRLLAAGLDGIAAYGAVVELASLDRSAAAERLAQLGIDDQQRAEILAATHCDPPPAYLVLSTILLRNLDLLNRGAWDVSRAELVHRLRDLPDEEALAAMRSRLGFTAEEAPSLLAQARTLRDPAAIERFVSPRRPFVAMWNSCRPAEGGEMTCVIRARPEPNGSLLVGLKYRPGAPESARLQFRRGEARTIVEQPPATTMVLGPEIAVARGDDPQQPYAAVIDGEKGRIIVGAANLIGTVLPRLLLLDGQFLQHFEKLEQTPARGESLSVWRIRW
ncbi:MAG TPA: hypothetical protein VEB21_21230, partial [Terriglobales bacterium]|nr:hypothetical protein [Terriglobales bacterium]